MMTWYRHLVVLLFGLGIITLALWSLEQGSGPYVILGVFGMACLTVMMIFGIEIDEIHVKLGDGLFEATIPFSNTGTGAYNTSNHNDEDDESDDE